MSFTFTNATGTYTSNYTMESTYWDVVHTVASLIPGNHCYDALHGNWKVECSGRVMTMPEFLVRFPLQ